MTGKRPQCTVGISLLQSTQSDLHHTIYFLRLHNTNTSSILIKIKYVCSKLICNYSFTFHILLQTMQETWISKNVYNCEIYWLILV